MATTFTSLIVIGYAAMVFGCAVIIARAFMRTGRR